MPRPLRPVPLGLLSGSDSPPSRRRLCRAPCRGRSRSDKHAAVLRPQRTRPKDRRVYTPLTGYPAWPAAGTDRNPNRTADPGPKSAGRRGQGRGRSLGYNIVYQNRKKKARELSVYLLPSDREGRETGFPGFLACWKREEVRGLLVYWCLLVCWCLLVYWYSLVYRRILVYRGGGLALSEYWQGGVGLYQQRGVF